MHVYGHNECWAFTPTALVMMYPLRYIKAKNEVVVDLFGHYVGGLVTRRICMGKTSKMIHNDRNVNEAATALF